MSRTTRTLVLVGAIGLLGLIALSFVARRYVDLLEQRKVQGPRGSAAVAAPEDADLDVARFVELRRRLAAVAGSTDAAVFEQDPEALARWVWTRDGALVELGWTLAGYRATREAYRRWREGLGDPAQPLARALERARPAVEAVDLGAYEALDP